MFSKLFYMIIKIENGFGNIGVFWCILGVYPIHSLNLLGKIADARRRWPWGAVAGAFENSQ